MDRRWIKGLELFKKKEYFECHEVIENLWLETPKSDAHRELYQGVIQAAAAIYQKERGITSGAKGLAKSSIGYLRKYKPKALGLDVSLVVIQMQNLLKELKG